MARKSNPVSRVIGYVRVSTDEQHQGPRAQRDALEAWCARHGAELVAVFEDRGVSGAAELDRRPGLLAALDALEAEGAGVLLVAKRDRLARDVMLAAMIERMADRAGATVTAADGAGEGSGPEALLLRRMVDAFAEYERAMIRARTRAALGAKRTRGERVGGVPLGARVAADGVHLEADPGEAEALEIVRELRAAGVSIRAIAAELNARGVPARGERWHPTTVARLVRRCA
jgi:DNA invertase Pin-like site-specific DNA recombinase